VPERPGLSLRGPDNRTDNALLQRKLSALPGAPRVLVKSKAIGIPLNTPIGGGCSIWSTEMATKYWLQQTLGGGYPADPGDVVQTKLRLQAQGYYREPDYGITEYPDTPMFDGIKRFQSDNGLQVDGLMRPGGPTETGLAARSPRYTCSECGAKHGGVYSPTVCADCWLKS
jgi:hypothetical protein